MSQEAMGRLEETVRLVVTGFEGSPESAMTVLATELRTRPRLLLDALKELSDLGSESHDRAPDAVDWARGLVSQVLRTFGFRDGWPNLGSVAQGIVDLMMKATQTSAESMRRTHP